MESNETEQEKVDENEQIEEIEEVRDAEYLEEQVLETNESSLMDEVEEPSEAGILGENGLEAFDAETPQLEDDEDTITFSFKRNHFYAALIPITFIIGLSVGYLFWGRTSAPAPTEVAQTNTTGQTTTQDGGTTTGAAEPAAPQESSETTVNVPEQVVRYDVTDDGDPSIGPDDAQITIIEFSDYECPFCRKFRIETFDRLLAAYPDQVRFVYRDFPLNNIHPEATPAAIAANCALEQDAYWEYHDQLFGGTQGLGDAAYQQYAANLGLNLDQFNLCLESDWPLAEIEADFQFAADLGIQSTPTFFINGIPLLGAQPFEVFQQIIDLELAGEIPK